jgi:hypothetical protein
MVNCVELVGSIHYVGFKTRFRVNRCYYNQVSMYCIVGTTEWAFALRKKKFENTEGNRYLFLTFESNETIKEISGSCFCTF